MCDKVPDNWLAICAAEMQRGQLTSCPKKIEFAKANGMETIKEVEDWMLKTRNEFERMVADAVLEHDTASAWQRVGYAELEGIWSTFRNRTGAGQCATHQLLCETFGEANVKYVLGEGWYRRVGAEA